MENKVIIIGAVVVFLFMIAILITNIVKETRRKKVEEESVVLKKLLILNQKYLKKFDNTILETYEFVKEQKSKAAYDRADHLRLLKSYLQGNEDFYLSIIKKAKQNKKLYAEYCNEYTAIYNNDDLFFEKKCLRKIEKKLIDEGKLSTVTQIELHMVNSYVSPKGRNMYTNRLRFRQGDIPYIIGEMRRESRIRESKEYQRSIMTDSLRYDIMKRDGFRCRLCGATQEDGVKLHVDHILPISKGGKTEANNLRTLCDRCNLGKRDKYDPAGQN